MQIKANIDDCALIISNFLPQELFLKIVNYNFKINNKRTSHLDWGKNLYEDFEQNKTMEEVKTSDSIGFFKKGKIDADDVIFENLIKIIVDCPFIPHRFDSKMSVRYYEYNKFSGINWHDDGTYTINYSFYIHNEWNKDWGGETLIDSGRGLPLACYPEPNSLLVVKNKVFHKVCPITGPKKRKVLQIRGIFYE